MSVLSPDGWLSSPYLIWIRCEGEITDAELLQAFGLTDYRLLPDSDVKNGLRERAVLADDGEWTLLADDWHYTLWHMPTTRPTIERLAAQFDVFACSVGDIDHSFDFIYYRGGQLVRHYVVIDPHFRGGEVATNIGEPLPGEKKALARKDEFLKVMRLAAGLGLQTTFTEHELLVYGLHEDIVSRTL